MNVSEIKKIIVRERKGTANLDPRCKIFFILGVGIVSFLLGGELSQLILMTGLFFLVSFGEEGKIAFKAMFIYILISYLNVFLKYITIPGISLMVIVLGVIIIKVIPIVLVGKWTLKTTRMDDLMVALQRMKFPQAVIIPFMVMFRYILTLNMEYKMIRNTMKIRGISDSLGKGLRHPILTIEYILVPLLMRCLKVSDELAASGMTRGLAKDGTRFSIYPVRFTIVDTFAIILGCLFFISLFILDKTFIGNFVVWRG
ncbi:MULTISPECIES: energy-coupling factor transporter transmembrane component T family protein [Clostridium]|uniref:Cobalt transport protein n=2 Tax=Clostridium TaxID=1485 RepID=A0A7X5SX04_CLOSG|nr:energy-coupling factor transporter transmembrane component T [Clostridium sporogenes]AJD30426.1 cobalt transport family protein [Clostridium botulinum Prevot_594]AVP60431.1 energy-coupling factor transporter transmembrane protein EcfT [Clostridium botulinum]AKC63019.1 cobalt transport protein [Clostridium sporogenes]AKJ90251.1 cobalt transporter [Clostridium sporogenes]AVP63834.1 energy-coupling factor transporter transmembrane protein EcfT [Clostridium botulinum]